jgi:cation:H+ antiporter
MVVVNLLFFVIFLIILLKFSDSSITHSSRLAKALKFPEFLVSFFIVTFISVLPEASISILSAFRGEPELGLGTLIGSNVADLTIVFGIVTLFSSKGIKVKSKIIQNNFYYLILLLLPLLLGINGVFSRIDGAILFICGLLFFIKVFKESHRFRKKFNNSRKEKISSSLIFLILCFAIILISAYYAVYFALNFANEIKLSPMIIGITIFALGTCLPELVFSIKAVRKNRESLALGDLLGTVMADATIILGLVALISPFSFNPLDIYISGTAMFFSGLFVTIFMKTDKTINKNEGLFLILLYLLFFFIQFFINQIVI